MLTSILLSFSVAADATAVAIAASIRGISWRRAVSMAVLFGAAQTLMAGLGWWGGSKVGTVWSAWDHWIALALLSAVGVKMIREALGQSTAPGEREPVFTSATALLVLAVATSLDALAVGVTLPALGTPAGMVLSMIGLVTCACTLAGSAFGRKLGERFGTIIEIAGGVGLIAIGVTIVVQHLQH